MAMPMHAITFRMRLSPYVYAMAMPMHAIKLESQIFVETNSDFSCHIRNERTSMVGVSGESGESGNQVNQARNPNRNAGGI